MTKFLDLLLAPLSWALLLTAAGFLARRRLPRLAWKLVALAGAVLLVFSSPAISDALMRWAERGAEVSYRPGETYDAVVVLGGVMEQRCPWRDCGKDLTGSAERITRTFELLREGRARNVLVSGGLLHPAPGVRSEAEQLADVLRGWGIAPERILVETRSRSTRENAVESAKVIAARGWQKVLLVTSAKHMPRAQGCFRRLGLAVDALPVDYRGGMASAVAEFENWWPRVTDLDESTEAIHELVGRLVYRVEGYTKD